MQSGSSTRSQAKRADVSESRQAEVDVHKEEQELMVSRARWFRQVKLPSAPSGNQLQLPAASADSQDELDAALDVCVCPGNKGSNVSCTSTFH